MLVEGVKKCGSDDIQCLKDKMRGITFSAASGNNLMNDLNGNLINHKILCNASRRKWMEKYQRT